MKKIFFALLLVSGFFLQRADAQVRVGVNVNLGSQPDWGPSGYDYAQFYYFPDNDIYYDVLNREFVYFDGYDWESSPYLPSMYNNFDLYRAYKVVINEPRPYLRNDYYRRQYYSYRGYHNQPVIRDFRNGHYNDRRDERFERRDDRYDQRDQHFDNNGRGDRDNHNGYEQRDSRGNRGRFEQNNRNGADQNNRNGSEENNRGRYEQRGNDNHNQRTGGNNHGGFGQRNDSRNTGGH